MARVSTKRGRRRPALFKVVGIVAEEAWSAARSLVSPRVASDAFRAGIVGYLEASPVVAVDRTGAVYARVNSMRAHGRGRTATLTVSMSMVRRPPSRHVFADPAVRGLTISAGFVEFYAYTFRATDPLAVAKRKFERFVQSIVTSPSRVMRPRFAPAGASAAISHMGSDEVQEVVLKLLRSHSTAAAAGTIDGRKRAGRSPPALSVPGLTEEDTRSYDSAKHGAITC